MSALGPSLPFHVSAFAPLWGEVFQIYDGMSAPPTASMCQSCGFEPHLREASVSEVRIIGLDIAKRVFMLTEQMS